MQIIIKINYFCSQKKIKLKFNLLKLITNTSIKGIMSILKTDKKRIKFVSFLRNASLGILIVIALPFHAKGQSDGTLKLGGYLQTGLVNLTTEKGINSFFRADDPEQIYPGDFSALLNLAKGAKPKVNYSGNPSLGLGLSLQYINTNGFIFISTGFQLIDYQTEQSFTNNLGTVSLLTHARDNRYQLETTMGKRLNTNFGLGFNFGLSRRVSKFDSHFLITNQETTSLPARSPFREKGLSLTFGASLPYFHDLFTAELRYDLQFASHFDINFSLDDYFSYQSQFHHWSIRVTIPLFLL